MTVDDQKEQFSFAYVRAVAAAAKIAVTRPEIDDDSVDLTFQQRGGQGTVRSPRLDAQIKCTEVANVSPTHVAYPLKIKNYDELRPTNLLVPRVLIVVIVPKQLTNWLNHSEIELAVRKCGYWLSLRGEPPRANSATITVRLPRKNQFSVKNLQAMMNRIGNGQPL